MLIRTIFSTLLLLTIVPTSFGQSRESDSQTLREILAEIRAMHEDMRVTESTQILVAELEMQQGAVIRATEKADSARAKLNDVHRDQKRAEAELEDAQERFDRAGNSDEQKALSSDIERRKSSMAALKMLERDSSTTLQEMEQRLRAAQDQLANIDDELNAAVSRLRPITKDAGQK